MIIYAFCGFFFGVLCGSWGVYWLFNRKRSSNQDTSPVVVSEEAPVLTAEEREEQRKTDEAVRAMYEGLMNLATYTGKPRKESGDLR